MLFDEFVERYPVEGEHPVAAVGWFGPREAPSGDVSLVALVGGCRGRSRPDTRDPDALGSVS